MQIRAVIDHAVRANVAIYAADARGTARRWCRAVRPRWPASAASQAFTGQSMSNQYDRMAGSQDTLTTLSEDTGGRAFLDSNDLGRVFKRVVEGRVGLLRARLAAAANDEGREMPGASRCR